MVDKRLARSQYQVLQDSQTLRMVGSNHDNKCQELQTLHTWHNMEIMEHDTEQ